VRAAIHVVFVHLVRDQPEILARRLA